MKKLATLLRNGKISLHDAFNSGEIPDDILRWFACDCAERALMREREAGRDPDPRSWNAVRVARLLAQGKATKEELGAAREAARDVAWAASLAASRAGYWAAWSAAWSADSASWASWAADSASRGAAEREWQRKHLADLLEWAEQVRPSLLRLLEARQRQLQEENTSVAWWAQDVETGLIEID